MSFAVQHPLPELCQQTMGPCPGAHKAATTRVSLGGSYERVSRRRAPYKTPDAQRADASVRHCAHRRVTEQSTWRHLLFFALPDFSSPAVSPLSQRPPPWHSSAAPSLVPFLTYTHARPTCTRAASRAPFRGGKRRPKSANSCPTQSASRCVSICTHSRLLG